MEAAMPGGARRRFQEIRMIRSIDPSTGRELARFDIQSDAEVEAAPAAAAPAPAEWSRTPVGERGMTLMCRGGGRWEGTTSEPPSLIRIANVLFCLKKEK